MGVLQGGATERWLSAAHPEIILNRTAKDAIQLFQMLENNRVDFIIGREYVFNIAAAADPKIKKTLKRRSHTFFMLFHNKVYDRN